MTTGTQGAAYGTAAGLTERAGAAFAAAVPENPADDGFFGPASVTWRLAGDLSALVAGLRSLLVQALHPLAMAGVDQHSDWRRDPVGRFASTSAYVATITYGDRATARRAAAAVRKIHTRVRGVDSVTGKPYAADDPDLLLWVHAVQVDSTLAAAAASGTEVTAADADRYVAEMRASAELIGIPDGMAPSTTAELGAYLQAVRPELQRTQAAADAAGFLLDPPGLDEEIADLWGEIREAVLLSLPDWASDMYGFIRTGPGTGLGAGPGTGPGAGAAAGAGPERRAQIRQVLGVLDAVLLGEPGVLEARQRIELRMRQARRA